MRRFFLLSGVLALLLACAALAADKSPADGDPAAWVDARVKERQVPPDERRFDEIGWARDIRAAEQLAKEHNRLVFLFTHDGRMNIGRC